MEVENNNIGNNMNTSIDSEGVKKLPNKRYTAFDVIKNKDVIFKDPYGRTAKRIYRQYIDLGY
eukprot:SAG11_NODE_30027_length_304_cov_79.931707_1_plen_62_part_10